MYCSQHTYTKSQQLQSTLHSSQPLATTLNSSQQLSTTLNHLWHLQTSFSIFIHLQSSSFIFIGLKARGQVWDSIPTCLKMTRVMCFPKCFHQAARVNQSWSALVNLQQMWWSGEQIVKLSEDVQKRFTFQSCWRCSKMFEGVQRLFRIVQAVTSCLKLFQADVWGVRLRGRTVRALSVRMSGQHLLDVAKCNGTNAFWSSWGTVHLSLDGRTTRKQKLVFNLGWPAASWNILSRFWAALNILKRLHSSWRFELRVSQSKLSTLVLSSRLPVSLARNEQAFRFEANCTISLLTPSSSVYSFAFQLSSSAALPASLARTLACIFMFTSEEKNPCPKK